jgi:hypothetical protein
MFKTKAIGQLEWTKESIEDALETHDFESLGIEAEEIMPDNPESAWVHDGDITVDGPLEIGGAPSYEDVACFIVNGNLTVNGPLFFNQDDFHSALYVTGELECKNAFLQSEAVLLVGKTLSVEELLYTFLSDAGYLGARGLTARYWLNEWYRGAIYFRTKPAATLLRGGDHKFLLDRDDDESEEEDERFSFRAKTASSVFDVLDKQLIELEEGVDSRKLRSAMAKGKPLFR